MEGRNTKCMNIAQFFFEIHDAEVEFIRKYPTEDSELQVRRTGKMSFFKSIMSILRQISRDQANLQSAGTKKKRRSRNWGRLDTEVAELLENI